MERDFKISVCVFVDEVVTLDVKSSTTIQQVMSQIRECADGFRDYLLLFGHHNLLDDPSSTLGNWELKDQDQLILTRRGLFNVRVLVGVGSGTKQSHIVPVETLDEVSQLKLKVEEETRIPVDKQHLYYCFNLMSDDTMNLASYGIFNPSETTIHPDDEDYGYVINLVTDDCICLPPYLTQVSSAEGSSSGCTIVVDIPSSIGTILLRLKGNLKDTLSTLKTMIHDKVRKLEADSPLAFVAEGLYVLLFNRKVLEDESLTLEECGIKEQDTLPEKLDQDRIVLCPMGYFQVTVALVLVEVPAEMEVLEVSVQCFDTVATLKTEIKKLMKISSKTQILLRFEERWLNDDKHCLVEYGIVEYPINVGQPSYYLRKRDTCIIEALIYGPLNADGP